MARTLVKICGLTRLADARAAHEAGADWLGLVVKGDSPRRVPVETAREIAAALDGVTTVAVMVGPTPDEAVELARSAGAARVQLHGIDPLAWPADFPYPAVIAVGVDADGSLIDALPATCHLVLLDTARGGETGGSGHTFPWSTAQVVAGARDVMLAGGLTPENVAAAIGAVRPFGVDASSRLESAPGIKDEARMRSFVAAVRACDAALGRE